VIVISGNTEFSRGDHANCVHFSEWLPPQHKILSDIVLANEVQYTHGGVNAVKVPTSIIKWTA